MKIRVNDVLKVFMMKFNNLLFMYASDPDRDEINLVAGTFIDDIPIMYQVQGKFKHCQCIIAMPETVVKLMFDPIFELVIDLPISDYDVDSVLNDGLIDDISTQLHNVGLTYEMEFGEFAALYDSLIKERNRELDNPF